MVTFLGESYYAVLKGMVRQEDIGLGFREGLRYRNIVSSQYIADPRLNLFQGVKRRTKGKLVSNCFSH